MAMKEKDMFTIHVVGVRTKEYAFPYFFFPFRQTFGTDPVGFVRCRPPINEIEDEETHLDTQIRKQL